MVNFNKKTWYPLLLSMAAANLMSMSKIAEAATISFNSSFSGPVELSNTFSLPKFDSSLGTLIQTTVILGGNFTSTGTATNNAASSQTAKVGTSVDYLLTLPGSNQLNLSLSAQTSFLSIAAGGSSSINLLSSSTANQMYTDVSTLALFTGSVGDLITLPLETFSGVSITGGGGNISTNLTTQATANVTVTYDYNQAQQTVPEPSTILSYFVLVGMGAVMKKK